MKEINWLEIFKNVCKKDNGALDWGLPEQWVHAELFSELKRQSNTNNWEPFSDEVPYITFYPVNLPKLTNRDWKKIGAVKYVDLCLKSIDLIEFLWFEFKVRNITYHKNLFQANFESRDTYKKDIVSLIGFSKELTSNIWKIQDTYTKSYKYDFILKDQFENILKAKHKFISCYLHLYSDLDDEIWNERKLKNTIFDWCSYRIKESFNKIAFPEIKLKYYKNFCKEKHSLIICKW